jgi:hypothetical protein
LRKTNLALERWLFDEYRVPPAGLGLLRILYAIVLLLRLPDGFWIADLPASVLDPPPGLTYFSHQIPSEWFFGLLNFTGVIAGVGVLFGWHTQLCSFLVSGVLLLLNSWSYSFGKINHDILFVLLPSFMAVAGWGGSYSLDAPRNNQLTVRYRAWPMALLALAISLAMFSAAAPKAMFGWLNPSTQAVKWHVTFSVDVRGYANPWALASLETFPNAAWELADVTTVILEAAFLFCVVKRRHFQMICALACFFHLGVAVLLELTFAANLLAYGAFCDWWAIERQAWVRFLIIRFSRWTHALTPRLVVPASCVLATVYVSWGNPVDHLLSPWTSDPFKAIGTVMSLLGAAAAVYFLIASGIRRVRGRALEEWIGNEAPTDGLRRTATAGSPDHRRHDSRR